MTVRVDVSPDPNGKPLSPPEPLRTQPDANGDWTVAGTFPDHRIAVRVLAACGEPTADGFQYVAGGVFVDRTAELSPPVPPSASDAAVEPATGAPALVGQAGYTG